MKGFSLLETIVAIAVLTLGILGPLSLATFVLSSAGISKNDIIAYNLAEEALEYVINARDSSVFRGQNWLVGLNDAGNQCDQVDGCYIDVSDTADPVKACSGPTCQNEDIIRRDTNTGVYNHKPASATNADTIFKRRIYLDTGNLINNHEIEVEVVISWSEKYFPNKSIAIKHHIFEKR